MLRIVEETGSTNADLLAALEKGERLAEGIWLIADRQSAGRGRQGRSWSGGAGNFMGSTVIRLNPGDPPAASFAFAAGLALHEASFALLPEPAALQLKWPNALMYGAAKLAGILLERAEDALVVGVGVNLASAPEIPGRATCAIADFAPAPDRDLFAQALAAALKRERERWRSYGLDPLLRRWQAAAHTKGTPLTVVPPGEQKVEGSYDGLEEDGALRLRLADGGLRVMHAGDVFFADRKG